MARVVVTGGSGFLGSHLADALLDRGDEVVAVDDLSTGRVDNVAHLADDARFALVEADVCDGVPVEGPVDAVLHFASPASPRDYFARPLETLRVGSRGTEAALELATDRGARFLLASTSEVYGDPLVHPQPESYRGNVSSTGPRAVYDEAKRYAEAVTTAYERTRGTDVRIVRIFNTFGPRMRVEDGRVVSNLLTQALLGEPLTVYGDGSQTRSFCYVDDLVAGVLTLLDSDVLGPVNIGNDHERPVLELAKLVLELTGSSSPIVHEPLPPDDPTRRLPDLTRARTELGWSPSIDPTEGLARTAAWFAEVLRAGDAEV